MKEEEFNFDFEIDTHPLHEDPNLYEDIFSPMSNEEFEDVESNESSISEDEDESFDICFTKALQ